MINLTFHGVGDSPRALPDGEARVWLDAGTFAETLDLVAGRGDVALHFDDGNASDVELALPALADRGLRATFFLVADRLGEPGFVDAAAARELVRAGMEIGCHGMRHRPWRGLSDAELHEELTDARELLADASGASVAAAACPFGAYDRRVLQALRRRGYARVYTSDGRDAPAGGWLRSRTSLGPAHGAAALAGMLDGRGGRGRAVSARARTAVKRWR